MSSEVALCGRLTLAPADLLKSMIGRVEWPDWWPFAQSSTTFTHRGRDAIWRGLAALKLTPGDEVLAPAYHCGSEVDVLVQAGLKVQLYQVDDRGQVNEVDLLERFGSHVRMIYITHMFGWPQIIPRVRSAAMAQQCPIMEDCALSLFSRDGDSPIGSRAAAAIFSLPKSLGVPDGGALVLRREIGPVDIQLKPAPRRPVVRRSLSLLKAGLNVAERPGNLPRSRRNASVPGPCTDTGDDTACGDERPDIPCNYYFNPAATDCRVSQITQRLVCAADTASIVSQRRENYTWLAERIRNLDGIEALYPTLEDGVSPLAMPILVDDSMRCATYLQRMGIEAPAWWWGFHRTFDYTEFPSAKWLKRHVVALPIHQEMRVAQLEYVLATIREYARLTSLTSIPTVKVDANSVRT